MASEKIFRSAVFGGFNRSDVISYIEDLRNEISDLQRKYADIPGLLDDDFDSEREEE